MKGPLLATWPRLGASLLAMAAAPLSAQSTDQGTLIIRTGAREVGTETFRITSDSGSLRVTARTVYGARAVELNSTFDRTCPTDAAFQLDWKGGTHQGQIYAVQKRNRITVRRVERGAEQASELPGGRRTAVLADSVFSIFYQLVWLSGQDGPVSVLYPQGNRRFSLTLERTPTARGTLVRFAGEIRGEIEIGNRGELLRIQLPSLGLEAARKPE